MSPIQKQPFTLVCYLSSPPPAAAAAPIDFTPFLWHLLGRFCTNAIKPHKTGLTNPITTNQPRHTHYYNYRPLSNQIERKTRSRKFANESKISRRSHPDQTDDGDDRKKKSLYLPSKNHCPFRKQIHSTRFSPSIKCSKNVLWKSEGFDQARPPLETENVRRKFDFSWLVFLGK